MAQIWLFIAGLVVMTLGILAIVIWDVEGRGLVARIGLGVTVLGLAIGLAGAFVG